MPGVGEPNPVFADGPEFIDCRDSSDFEHAYLAEGSAGEVGICSALNLSDEAAKFAAAKAW